MQNNDDQDRPSMIIIGLVLMVAAALMSWAMWGGGG